MWRACRGERGLFLAHSPPPWFPHLCVHRVRSETFAGGIGAPRFLASGWFTGIRVGRIISNSVRDAGARYKPVCAPPRRVDRMRSRRMPTPAFINALYTIDGSRKDRMVVRVRFHASHSDARTLHILIMTDLDLFFATYDERILLTKAWKMNDALIKVVVRILCILIELTSNSA